MGSQKDQEAALPEGIFSLLDTDLYKLTMQCAVLKYFPKVEVTYSFTNRTADKKLTREAFQWLNLQINKLGNISLSDEELNYLQTTCPYFSQPYLDYLAKFRLQPAQQIDIVFDVEDDTGSDGDVGVVHLEVKGPWVETILYEIPLLALTSEAFFKFCDCDWTYQGQEDKAYYKGTQLLQHGCLFSEFGTRRRRDYHTQDLVLKGLLGASKTGRERGWKGRLTGTSNVHFAMNFGLQPIGTVAHEWFMGIAAITDSYEQASEIALRYWVSTFGEGVLGIALTDTFGTSVFLRSFRLQVPDFTIPEAAAAILPSTSSSTTVQSESLSRTEAPLQAMNETNTGHKASVPKTYAQVFTGVRQDSGSPAGFIKIMRDFYDEEGIRDKKTIVFSDSLNIELCLEYMQEAEDAGFQPTFGVGTFFTNDFKHTSNGTKSVPLNIVIKLSSAAGRPAVKISDNIGKNTGDKATVESVKQRLGYVERRWEGGDESKRWGI